MGKNTKQSHFKENNNKKVSWSIKSVQVETSPNKQQYKISSDSSLDLSSNETGIYPDYKETEIFSVDQTVIRLWYFINFRKGSEETNKGERCP